MKRTHLRDTHWTRERPNAFVAAMGGQQWRGSTGCQAIVTVEPTGLHISVSAPGRYPTWDELASARDKFGGPDRRMVMHFPPRAEYVNVHDTCLHLHDAEATP